MARFQLFPLQSKEIVDCFFLGGVTAPVGTAWAVQQATGMGTGLNGIAFGNIALPGATGSPYQSALTLAAPVTGRYFRVVLTPASSAAVSIGNLCIGAMFKHPYAYGSGRPLIDSTRRSELFDGGFGVDEGTIKLGFRWRFVDLSPARADELMAELLQLGIGKPIVAIEDVDIALRTTALHYGLFDKFEPWERANPVDTVWALSMTEWR